MASGIRLRTVFLRSARGDVRRIRLLVSCSGSSLARYPLVPRSCVGTFAGNCPVAQPKRPSHGVGATGELVGYAGVAPDPTELYELEIP